MQVNMHSVGSIFIYFYFHLSKVSIIVNKGGRRMPADRYPKKYNKTHQHRWLQLIFHHESFDIPSLKARAWHSKCVGVGVVVNVVSTWLESNRLDTRLGLRPLLELGLGPLPLLLLYSVRFGSVLFYSVLSFCLLYLCLFVACSARFVTAFCFTWPKCLIPYNVV